MDNFAVIYKILKAIERIVIPPSELAGGIFILIFKRAELGTYKEYGVGCDHYDFMGIGGKQ